ncbi:unnamed protein product [Trichobilharzia szidati]|nr:unnamed protein product [Trichobilharzia szidati]CAH8866867.1 unnamed protein product [Trichobilharzia szidati]
MANKLILFSAIFLLAVVFTFHTTEGIHPDIPQNITVEGVASNKTTRYALAKKLTEAILNKMFS